MKKLICVLVILFIAVGVTAQVIDPKLLDLSEARVSIAGPDKIYVRSIYYAGQELSVILKYDGRTGAVIYGPYFAGVKQIPDSIELGFVRLRLQGTDKIAISHIVLGDQLAYSGMVKWDGGEKLLLDSLWKSMPPKTFEERIAKLSKENAELSKQSAQRIAQLNKKIEELRAARVAVAEPAKAEAVPAAPEALPARAVFSGFKNGKALFGDWKISYSTIEQADRAMRYAKFSIPVSQNKSETLFGFTAKASDARWIGYGLHFFASGEQTGTGYGFGSSFLIWLTKDPEYYQSEKTYLQLYRSFDDVKMVQTASISIPESITSSLKTEVLYNRSDNTMSVFVNGKKRLDYKVGSPIWRGDKIVLRTLGGAVEFSDLYIKTH